MLSSSYDHDEKHFRFSRSHTGEIMASAPIKAWWPDLLAGALIFAFIAMVVVGSHL